MHGTHQLHPPTPRIADHPQWRPDSIAEVERLLGAGLSHAAVAASLGVPTAEFSSWLINFRTALSARPDAINCIKHLMDLRRERLKPPPITADDVPRRADALARAEALAARLPIWPGALEPIEWRPESYPCGYSNRKGGWERDEDGVARREKRINGTKLYRKVENDDGGEDDGPIRLRPPREKVVKMIAPAIKPDLPAINVNGSFPLTIAAAQKRDGSVWELGEALIAETPMGKTGRYNGSIDRIAEAQKVLAEHGINYSHHRLMQIRQTTSAFPPASRTAPFSVCVVARKPETLAAIAKAKPAGQALTYLYVRAGFPRQREGAGE